jgi:D-glycero-alpha-D-manno-heptose-7-phosphate kinase
MLFYSGIRRTSSDIAHSMVEHFDDKKRELRLTHELVRESLSILNGREDMTRFGELLHEGWLLKRGMSERVTNPAVDEMYDAARSAGAIGGKLTGAGGGGFMLLFVPPEKRKEVRERLKHLIYVPFAFERSGSQVIFFDPEEDFESLERTRDRQDIRPFREWNQAIDD